MELNYIIASIAVAAFGIQVAISDLADKVKTLFGLNQTHKYTPLLNIHSWIRIIGLNWFVILFPFIYLVIAMLYIHKFVAEMVSCQFCISFWLMFIVNVFYFNTSIITGLIYAPFALAWVTVLDKLMR